MAINETQKLRRLMRHSQEEFLPQGSLLNQTRLNRFILIALLLHVSVIFLQTHIIAKPKDLPIPPPIKVKYVDIQKPEPIDKKGTLIKAPKPTKAKKQKKYHQIKTAAPQIRGKPNITKRTQAQVNFKKTPVRLKQRATKKNTPIPLSDKVPVISGPIKQDNPSVPSEKLGSRGVLSMLDGLDVKKYAMQDTRTLVEDGSDDDKPISLNTTEPEYVSYFNRIKHQIQLVWRYPAQAAQRKVSGQLTLNFQVSRNGNLLGVRLVDNSGFEILDLAAVKAVKEAAPYYPFPITIHKKKISILATFIYSPNSMQSNAQ